MISPLYSREQNDSLDIIKRMVIIMDNVFITKDLTVEELSDLRNKMMRLAKYDPLFRKLAVEVTKIAELKRNNVSYLSIVETLWSEGFISTEAYKLAIIRAKDDAKQLIKVMLTSNE